jgi:hypothetical protein
MMAENPESEESVQQLSRKIGAIGECIELNESAEGD